MKKQKGITLIALVVTIIVLIILAGVSITALTDDEKGIVTKAKEAASKTEIATEDEDFAIKELMNYADSNDEFLEDDGGDTNETETTKNLIPVGGTYTVYSTGNILVGDGISVEFPKSVEAGDRYSYGDYKYLYNYYETVTFFPTGWQVWTDDNTKTTLGAFLETINGEPITNMCGAFNSEALVGFSSDFKIPDTVSLVESAFSGCTSLVTLPENCLIPEGCTDLSNMFFDCTSLEYLPNGFTIPQGVTTTSGMFESCSSLKSLPSGFTIPSGVDNVASMFDSCTSLNATVIVNANPSDYDYCFFRCASVTLSGSSNMLTALKNTIS